MRHYKDGHKACCAPVLHMAQVFGRAITLIVIATGIERMGDAMCTREVPYDMGGTITCGGLPTWMEIPSSDFWECHCEPAFGGNSVE